MNQSESIKELAQALVKAQGEMGTLAKDSTGQVGSQKTNYASLTAVIDVVGPAFRNNGLAYTQFPIAAPEGRIGLRTILLHTSGEWIEDVCELPVQNTAQGHGSGLTYARRYALQAIAGIAAEDDDGAGAMPTRPAGKAQNRQQSQWGGDETPRDVSRPPAANKSTGWKPERLNQILADHGLKRTDLAVELGPVNQQNFTDKVNGWLSSHDGKSLNDLADAVVEHMKVTPADLTPTSDVRQPQMAGVS